MKEVFHIPEFEKQCSQLTKERTPDIHVHLNCNYKACVELNRLTRDLKQTTKATATRTPLNKGLKSKTIAMHVRYKSLYISLPSSANNNVK